MLAKVRSCAVVGMEGVIVEVEVDISPGLPFFGVVGLPDAAVQEARERVRAAVRNSGFKFPMTRVVAALAPANLKKAGPAYDLPIAVAMLIATGQAPPKLTVWCCWESSASTAHCGIRRAFCRWSPPVMKRDFPGS